MGTRRSSWWRRVNIPVVIAAAGVAAVISAFAVALVLIGLVIADSRESPPPPQPSVIDIGAAQPGGATQPSGAAPSSESPEPSTHRTSTTEPDGAPRA